MWGTLNSLFPVDPVAVDSIAFYLFHVDLEERCGSIEMFLRAVVTSSPITHSF